MSKQQDTIDKAFGNVPKEIPGAINWDWLPTRRGVKYYFLTLWRKLFR